MRRYLEECYYILFDNHEDAIILKKQLRKADIDVRISPTPRVLSVCCGVSLMFHDESFKAISDYIKNNNCTYQSIQCVEQEFNGERDKYL